METPHNDYTVVKQLSSVKSKRFGQVFLVKKPFSEELFVLKTVEKSNELGLKQLLNEAQFSFDSRGLPEIIDIVDSADQYSIVKKYAPGISLSEFWLSVKKRHRVTKLKEIVLSLEPIFSALEKNKIIHGDVKPENIIIYETSGKLECSLIDFGLAFYLNQIPNRKTLFQLAYSAPEIILNRLNCANYSTDVFSFCLVTHRLFSGKLLFSNSNPALQTQLQITYPIERPFLFKKNLWRVLEKGLVKHQFRKPPNKYSSEELDTLLMDAAGKRYSSFNELAKEISKIY